MPGEILPNKEKDLPTNYTNYHEFIEKKTYGLDGYSNLNPGRK